ncbi:hypothetical protein [Rhizobium sp.]|uniref:hypothetical protein n=1 Tax=Rhizobium sp. TaxID=391 RepID=UPI0028993E3A
MAESMLLLVFCLLLATGALIMKAQDDLRQAKAAEAELQENLDKKNETIALLTEQLDLANLSANASTDMSALWRELSISRKAIGEMKSQNVTLQDAVDSAPTIRKLLDGQLTPDAIQDAQSLLAELKARALTVEDVSQLAELSEKLKQLALTVDESEKLKPAIPLIKETLLVSQHRTSKEIFEEIIAKAAEAEEAKAKLAAFQQTEGDSKPHAWPPIINLSETKGYFFRSGSAELDPRFRDVLENTVAKQIGDIAHQYDVDVIEVVGHTDEQGMGKRQSNLDYDFKPVLNGSASVGTLQPGDNAGLGLARAIAVTQALKAHPNLAGLTILPMSGAQLILPNDSLTSGAQVGDVASRRRIEIRVRKRNQQSDDGTPTLAPTPLTVDAPALSTAPRTVKPLEVFSPEERPARVQPAIGNGSTR